MGNTVIYIHGSGGSAAEAEHYRPLFPKSVVTGLDYHADTPWAAGQEIRDLIRIPQNGARKIVLIANSIGAFFAMHAGIDAMVARAYFISPIVDMERLILTMLAASNATESELQKSGTIHTPFGEDLSWEYLCYVRQHPLQWSAPTEILYGERDTFTSYETMAAFARAHGARLTVMEQGEHWFHTAAQMAFLDDWIKNSAPPPAR